MVFDLLSLDEELRGPAEELAAECGARLGKGTKIYAEKADRLFVKKKRSAYTVGYSQKHEFSAGCAGRSPVRNATRAPHIRT